MRYRLLPMTFSEICLQLSDSFSFTQEACDGSQYTHVARFLNLDPPLYKYTSTDGSIIVYDYGRMSLVEASFDIAGPLARIAYYNSVKRVLDGEEKSALFRMGFMYTSSVLEGWKTT